MDRQQIVEKMKTKLDHWNADIDALERKADGAQQSGQQEIHATLDSLQRVRDAGDDAYQDLHQGFEKGWEEVSAAFRQARQRFN